MGAFHSVEEVDSRGHCSWWEKYNKISIEKIRNARCQILLFRVFGALFGSEVDLFDAPGTIKALEK